ncbi:oxidoreductase [Aliirhizobium cellulosilyticum]|uniref:Short-subunit dehydrogenase n=1 Tax=Aliirhizobium cellulosilyticum TaxID=393664 RepID=A0A7W6V2W8_9HYPH|nr:oxidoreductase [Rhizobium cellulosilyticum]MBB4351076.1 short-subunit dehydrogenase [Rhizobium cellulosilyticum]MBB4414348.1 short-subunit dehydrogenase [Rhizobium cellulosilyticum]MBB4448964.1 short-subunit dehydrogenase [Rhizobium cellulosilyticum]
MATFASKGQKTAFVTGASSGIGKAAALAFSRAGYRVVGTSRKAVPDEIRDGIRMIACDVTSDASVAGAVALADAELGRIDLLVNNAGYAVSGAAEESSIEQVRALFNTNFLGVVRVTNAVLPIMRQQRDGRILNIGSVVGLIPGPFGAYYTASKHAIEGYSESLDHEVRSFGIRVAVIEPWATKTSIEANSPQGDLPVAACRETFARYQGAFNAAMAEGDTADDVAATILAAGQARKLQLRYPSGKAARQTAFARRFLPRALFDRILRKQFNIA